MVSVKGEIAFWYVVKTMMVRKLKVELVEAPIMVVNVPSRKLTFLMRLSL